MAENSERIGYQDSTDLREWMHRMEESNELQAKYARKQYRMAKLGAVCNVCVLLIVIGCLLVLMPKLLSTFEQVDTVMGEMETVVGNLEEASVALAETDLTEMLDGVNTLVEDSQTGVAEAMEKIAALDIETMNEAIGDLKAVVEPLAKLFGK